MKKFCYWLFLAVMLFATMNSGCGGSGGDDIAIPKTDTQTQTSDAVRIVIDDSDTYTTVYKAFYAREAGGEWVLLAESEAGDVSFDIYPTYTDYGFEFYTIDEATWGYSGLLWSSSAAEVSDAAAPRKVEIILRGTKEAPTVETRVDGRTVSNGSSQNPATRNSWGSAAGNSNRNEGKIYVTLSGPSAYILNTKNFYGRQRGGKWVNLTNGSSFIISNKYVEFGFEFDITWGTDWPYSNVFWTAEDTEKETPTKIDISMGGTVRWANIEIKVNNRSVVSDSGCESHSRYKW